MEINLKTLDLNLLRVLVAVGDAGSISRAAERIGMSQPATSNALARLRVATGDQLFVRSKSGMVPTPYAERALPGIRLQLEQLFASIAGEESFDAKTTERVFRLSLSGLGELVFLPRLLKTAMQKAPNICLDNVQVPAENLGDALGSGQVDCAIGLFDLSETGVTSQVLFRDYYVAVAGAGLTTNPASLDELREYRLAISAPSASYGAEMGELVSRHGLDNRVAVRLSSFGAMAQVLETLPLVAVVPRQFADQLVASRDIRILPVALDQSTPAVRLIWHQRAADDPASIWLRDLILEEFVEKG